MRIGRRALLAGLGATACSRRRDARPLANASVVAASPVVPLAASVPVDAAPARGTTRLVTWSIADRGPTGEVAVLVPDDPPPPSGRYPLVIALHGHGEAMRGPKEGAMGWPFYYGLDHAIARVANPPLGPDDVQGFVDDARLASYNMQLTAHPYGGLVVVCPYLPELNVHEASEAVEYGRYLVDAVLPRARRELPVFDASVATGIDGVSMGGATALRVGLARTDVFAAVGALQPAIAEYETGDYVEIYRAARARRPGLALRLTTSHDDVYKPAVSRLSAALRAAGVEHDYSDVPGPHDYPFNRGPGAIELLLWHDRVLARV